MSPQTSSTPPHAASSDPNDRMMQMIFGYWITQIVRGAAECHLADLLQGRSLTADQIALAQDMDAEATFRFLRACASLGLASYDGKAKFASTPLLDTLRSDHPRSLRGLALSQAAPGHWQPWGRFTDVLRTGKSQTLKVLGCELFDYFAKTPAEAEAFTQSMNDLTATVSQAASHAINLENVSCAVDVGAAGGAFLVALMKASPTLRGIAFDLPNVAQSARIAAAEAGVADRMSVVGGDFLDSVPSGDLYLLKHILHDWDDQACVAILGNCLRAMKPGGRIAVIELVLGEIGEPGLAPLMDVNMMVMLRGRERTFAEYGALFKAAGFGDVKIAPTSTPMAVLEATAA